MAEDIFPSNDAAFDQFQKHLISNVSGNSAKYGLTASDVTGLEEAQTVWAVAYPAHLKAQDDARTATQTKDVTRGKFEGVLRAAARKINGSPSVDNAVRASVGLPTRDGTRSSIGAPTTRPLGRIEFNGRSALVIHFVDEETPRRTAKPYGVHGCQIWGYVGDAPPADPSGYTFLALDTRTPYIDEHEAADVGKSAYYLLRWQNPRGEPGPWSEVVTAVIPR